MGKPGSTAGHASRDRAGAPRTLEDVFQDPGPCPCCEQDDLVRKGGKDQCPTCHYLQPCCDGGDLCGVTGDRTRVREQPAPTGG